MHLIVLHGAVGVWDEVACLAIPATVILGVALAVLREKPAPDAAPVADAAGDTTGDPAEDPTEDGRAARGEQP